VRCWLPDAMPCGDVSLLKLRAKGRENTSDDDYYYNDYDEHVCVKWHLPEIKKAGVLAELNASAVGVQTGVVQIN